MFVIAAPGQGSQKPGFLGPWLESPDAREQLGVWSDSLGVDLITHGTLSDEDTIKDTAIAQPLIVASSILTGRALLSVLPDQAKVRFAGHSVGEFAAAALAGVISDDDAMTLVALRGSAMARASAEVETGMSAVIGADTAELDALLPQHGLFAANFNGAGQVVIAGERKALQNFAENAPAGSRVIPLSVAGAFHTRYMSSAVQALADAAASVDVHDPHLPLYTNRDGSLVESGTSALAYMVEQVERPVRWDSCMASFERDGIEGMMELAPAGALVGLAKRALKGVPTVALNTPEDLEVAVDMMGAS